MRPFIVIFFLLTELFTSLSAQESFHTRKVSIFKNGSAFYQKSGEIEVEEAEK